MKYVLDSNVAVKWVLPESGFDESLIAGKRLCAITFMI